MIKCFIIYFQVLGIISWFAAANSLTKITIYIYIYCSSLCMPCYLCNPHSIQYANTCIYILVLVFILIETPNILFYNNRFYSIPYICYKKLLKYWASLYIQCTCKLFSDISGFSQRLFQHWPALSLKLILSTRKKPCLSVMFQVGSTENHP